MLKDKKAQELADKMRCAMSTMLECKHQLEKRGYSVTIDKGKATVVRTTKEEL